VRQIPEKEEVPYGVLLKAGDDGLVEVHIVSCHFELFWNSHFQILWQVSQQDRGVRQISVHILRSVGVRRFELGYALLQPVVYL